MGEALIYPENGPWAELDMDCSADWPIEADWIYDEVYEYGKTAKISGAESNASFKDLEKAI